MKNLFFFTVAIIWRLKSITTQGTDRNRISNWSSKATSNWKRYFGVFFIIYLVISSFFEYIVPLKGESIGFEGYGAWLTFPIVPVLIRWGFNTVTVFQNGNYSTGQHRICFWCFIWVFVWFVRRCIVWVRPRGTLFYVTNIFDLFMFLRAWGWWSAMKVGHIWNTWTIRCAVENEMLFLLRCYSQSFLDPKTWPYLRQPIECKFARRRLKCICNKQSTLMIWEM